MASGVDTVLQLYDMDGITVLASEDKNGDIAASRVEWSAPASGTYFIRVTKASDSTYGCNAKYNINALHELQSYLPFIQK